MNRDLSLILLTIKQTFFEKKIIFVSILLLLPLILGVIWATQDGSDESPLDFFIGLSVLLYLNFVTIVLALVNATPLIHSELEDGTATYLISRPIPRYRIVLDKFVGFVVSNLPT